MRKVCLFGYNKYFFPKEEVKRMRTSLAIACLAGVALASKSKSYRNKHTAATAERPAGDCLTMEAYFDLSDTACDDIWTDWKS